MRMFRDTKHGTRGFFDPAIGGALFLIYSAIAAWTVADERSSAASDTEQVAEVRADRNADSNRTNNADEERQTDQR